MLKLETPLKSPFRILIIVAHPDDIEFGAGGSVAVWTDAGAEIHYCITTDGSAGSNAVDDDLVELIERRKVEQAEAAAWVGVRPENIHYLGYKDGALQPTLELRRDCTRLIRQVRPDRVIIMDPTAVLMSTEDFSYINHPDHRASGEAALYAVFPSSETRPIFPELLAEGLEPHHVNELYLVISSDPNTAVDVSGVIDRKIKSLLAHRSQIGEEAAEFVKQFGRRTGEEIGVEYAEAFRVLTFYNDPPAEPLGAAADMITDSMDGDVALVPEVTSEVGP